MDVAMLGKAIKALKATMGHDDAHPSTWIFGDLERDPKTGLFDDDVLVQILKEATDEVAGAFGARGERRCRLADPETDSRFFRSQALPSPCA